MAERMCPEMELEVMRLDALDHTIREIGALVKCSKHAVGDDPAERVVGQQQRPPIVKAVPRLCGCPTPPRLDSRVDVGHRHLLSGRGVVRSQLMMTWRSLSDNWCWLACSSSQGRSRGQM